MVIYVRLSNGAVYVIHLHQISQVVFVGVAKVVPEVCVQQGNDDKQHYDDHCDSLVGQVKHSLGDFRLLVSNGRTVFLALGLVENYCGCGS